MSNNAGLRQVSQDELDRMFQAHEAYRNDPSNPKVEFHHLLLKGLNLPEELSHIDFSYTSFEDNSQIESCSFCSFNNVNLKKTSRDFSQFQRLYDCNFSSSRFTQGFEQVLLERVEFRDCYFSSVGFYRSSLFHLTFKRCEFDFCNFRGVLTIHFVDFGGARLKGCDLTDVDMQFCGGFVLDNTMTSRMRLPLRSDDPWSQLVRSYTGANLLFNFLFLAAFFTPFIVKGLGLIALSHLEARLSERLAVIASKAAEYPSLVEIQKALDPCATFRCEPVSVWRVLLGHDVSWWVFGIGMALLAYNVARALLTWRIAPLKQEEEVSGRSPHFLPNWTRTQLWEAVLRRDWTALVTYKDELWHAYAPLWWIHKAMKYAFFATIILSLLRLIGFFQEQVYLPTMR